MTLVQSIFILEDPPTPLFLSTMKNLPHKAIPSWETIPGCFKIRSITTRIREPESEDFLRQLQAVIHQRRTTHPIKSHVRRMFDRGFDEIVRKVGEEAIELMLAAKNDDRKAFLHESADLMFHFLLLCEAKDVAFDEVIDILKKRKQNRK